jgi:hypothetical protein
MMTTHPEDDTSSLERARERLYKPGVSMQDVNIPKMSPIHHSLPHAWEDSQRIIRPSGKRRMRFAGMFFIVAFLFFLVSLGIAGYFLYFGGNSVSVDKIAIGIQGPTTIAGGDTVPLSLTITNKNSTAIQNATIEIDFPDGTRDASNVLTAYPRYTENLGTIASGASVTRSVKVIMFGGSGASLTLPVSFSFGATGSNTVFVKKSSFALAVSSTPLSVSVDAPSQTVSGAPFTLTLTARSNATVPIDNVVLSAVLPFGFSVTSSSLKLNDSSFLIGTLSPGASKTIMLTGVLVGQDNEQQSFHFTIGTAKTANDQTLAVTYLTQDATVTIAAPFISTALSLNGNSSSNTTITPGSSESVTVSYTNTLQTSIQNAEVDISLSGSAVDYNSIKTSSGFYRSTDHTIVFSKDTDPSLANLAPGASGIGVFTFSTLAPGVASPSSSITFTATVSGTNTGQANSQEETTSTTETIKVATTVLLSSSSLHSSGQFSNSGPIPPRSGQATTYTIVWNTKNEGNAIAGGTVSTILPSYVSYTGVANSGFSYDSGSHVVTWNIGDIAQNTSAQGSFQVSITPSTSQKGSSPTLTGPVSFSGYDRFAGVQISASADPVTTETPQDPGYTGANATVQ